MWRRFFTIVGVGAVVWLAPGPLFPADEGVKESSVAQVEKRIDGMNGILKKLYREVAKAKEENDIHRLNCLMTKLNLVKGLLKASERAKVVLMESFYGGDKPTAGLYLRKVNSYWDSAVEVDQSIPECKGAKTVGEGQSLVYIRPEGEPGVEPQEQSPWDYEFLPGSEAYPVVPPASPFR